MINLKKYKGVEVYDSYEFYCWFNGDGRNYSRWIKSIINKGYPDFDWFNNPKSTRCNKRYYFTNSFCQGLCLSSRSSRVLKGRSKFLSRILSEDKSRLFL